MGGYLFIIVIISTLSIGYGNYEAPIYSQVNAIQGKHSIYLPKNGVVEFFSEGSIKRKLKSSLNFILPKGYGFYLNCSQIHLQKTQGCSGEYLSFKERTQLGYLGKVCRDTQNFNISKLGIEGKRYKLQVDFKKSMNKGESGGSFQCMVTAKPNIDPRCTFMAGGECFHVSETSVEYDDDLDDWCNDFFGVGSMYSAYRNEELSAVIKPIFDEMGIDVWVSGCATFPSADPTRLNTNRDCSLLYPVLCIKDLPKEVYDFEL